MKIYLSPEELIQVIQTEIVWCLDHPDTELNHDQQMGFMNGLRQAQYLIREANKKALEYKSDNYVG